MMKTILVPTDFSSTAKNAAHYALALAKDLGANKIIFYNAYQQPVTADPVLNTVELYDMGEFGKLSENGLQNFIKNFDEQETAGLKFETVSEYNLLTAGIEELCKQHAIDLIVMGVTGGGKLEETLIGSNTISVATHINIPVIIVPTKATYQPIKEIVLACDFKKVVETTPVAPLKKILDETKAKLFVLNIDHNNKSFTTDTPHESVMLDTLLYNYQPEYHFIESEDFTEAINQFAEKNKVDLVVTMPKKHGWFEGLFRRSHTKMLAFHSHVPLMVMHE